MKQTPGTRRQQRLADLHRSVSAAVQSLHQHQVVLVTAMRGEDATMQQLVLKEHQARVAAAMQEMIALSAFVDRLRSTQSQPAEGPLAGVILRAG